MNNILKNVLVYLQGTKCTYFEYKYAAQLGILRYSCLNHFCRFEYSMEMWKALCICAEIRAKIRGEFRG